MLFKEVHLQGVKSGKITLAFRKWQKASVKNGSLLHTSIGLVEIRKVETVYEDNITDQDAIDAGFADKQQLIKSFRHNSTGTIFKISVNYYLADPRIQLREQTELSEQQFTNLKNKLERLDSYSKRGDWTRKILLTIRDNPHLHAIGIAKLTGFEKRMVKAKYPKIEKFRLDHKPSNRLRTVTVRERICRQLDQRAIGCLS